MILIILRLLFFFLLGIFSYYLYLAHSADKTNKWDKFVAQIVNFRIEKVRNPDSSSLNLYSYFPVITYIYSVGENEFSGNSLRYATGINFQEGYFDIDEISSKFALGATITVFVDPLNPSNSVVKPGISHHLWFSCFFFGSATLISGLAALVLPAQLRREKITINF